MQWVLELNKTMYELHGHHFHVVPEATFSKARATAAKEAAAEKGRGTKRTHQDAAAVAPSKAKRPLAVVTNAEHPHAAKVQKPQRTPTCSKCGQAGHNARRGWC